MNRTRYCNALLLSLCCSACVSQADEYRETQTSADSEDPCGGVYRESQCEAAWRAEYYSVAPFLASQAPAWDPGSTPNVTTTVESIGPQTVDWGLRGPIPGVTNYFVARWTRWLYFPEGTYTFKTSTDDGVRLFVDKVCIIDQWEEGIWLDREARYEVPGGFHEVRMEYFERQGLANASLSWECEGPCGISDSWDVQYYPGEDLDNGDTVRPYLQTSVTAPATGLSGASLTVEFGDGGPLDSSGSAPLTNGFSARFSRKAFLWSGFYSVETHSDDGIRVYMDNLAVPVLSSWEDQNGSLLKQAPIAVLTGEHDIVIEYYERTGQARMDFNLIRIGDSEALHPPTWQAEYFNNESLAGNPIITTIESQERSLHVNWGIAPPDPDIPPDHFSARFTRTVELQAGAYVFTTHADDTIRVYLDNRPIIDTWTLPNASPTSARVEVKAGGIVAPGSHELRIEYQEIRGQAFVQASWEYFAEPPTTATLRVCAQENDLGDYVDVYDNGRNLVATGTPDWSEPAGQGAYRFAIDVPASFTSPTSYWVVQFRNGGALSNPETVNVNGWALVPAWHVLVLGGDDLTAPSDWCP